MSHTESEGLFKKEMIQTDLYLFEIMETLDRGPLKDHVYKSFFILFCHDAQDGLYKAETKKCKKTKQKLA